MLCKRTIDDRHGIAHFSIKISFGVDYLEVGSKCDRSLHQANGAGLLPAPCEPTKAGYAWCITYNVP